VEAKGIEFAIAMDASVKQFDFQDGYLELPSFFILVPSERVESEGVITLPYHSKKISACIS